MKRITSILSVLVATVAMSTSCDFLTEHPVTFVSPENYYNNEAEIEAATLGCYTAIRTSFFENYGFPGCEPYFLLERMTGNVQSKHGIGSNVGLPVTSNNACTEIIWANCYSAIENCTGTIAGISKTKAEIDESIKNRDMAEAYFLRAYYYFELVRLFGPIPYKTTMTTGVENAALPCTSEADVYAGIVADLQKAEQLFGIESAMAVTNGRAGLGAAKALLAKVYLTMAGYPLQKTECYQLAYDKASEIVASEEFELFASLNEWRLSTNKETKKENIFSVQHQADNATSYLHRSLLPYDYPIDIATGTEYGGHMLPTENFYNAFSDSDSRKEAFFYWSYPSKDDASVTVSFVEPHIFKFFDETAIANGKSACKFPIIRYADVLLVLAEAACKGGSTTDAKAIKAYSDVVGRAMGSAFKAPTSISADDVLVQRFYEFCYEDQSWYDMLRTRKAFNTGSKTMVNMIGYKGETCPSAYDESYLYMPYPEREYALNPNLKR